MLAKRLIVAAFAAFVVVASPLAFSGNSHLLGDTPKALTATIN
jgi:hypothetical protein